MNAQGDYEGLADPGHDLLQARFNWISGMVRQSTARFAEAATAASTEVGPRRRPPPPTLEEEVVRRRTLLEALILMERPDIDAITHIDLPDHRRWLRVLEHTEFVASALAVALPDLARAVRLYCDGHLNRVRRSWFSFFACKQHFRSLSRSRALAQRGGSGPLVRPLQNADEAKAMVATLMDAFVTAIEAVLPPYAPPAAQAAMAQDSHRLPHAPWIPSVSGHAAATPTYGSSGQPPALLGLEPLEAAYFIARMANAVGLVAEAMRAAAPKLGSAAWINHVDEAVGPRLLRLKLALARLLVDCTSYGATSGEKGGKGGAMGCGGGKGRKGGKGGKGGKSRATGAGANFGTCEHRRAKQSCASLAATRPGSPTWYVGGVCGRKRTHGANLRGCDGIRDRNDRKTRRFRRWRTSPFVCSF